MEISVCHQCWKGGGRASGAAWASEFASDHPHLYKILINIIPLVTISPFAEIQISFRVVFIFYGLRGQGIHIMSWFPRICHFDVFINDHKMNKINMYRKSSPFSSWNAQSNINFLHKNTLNSPNGYR